jgi:hypothetical protein
MHAQNVFFRLLWSLGGDPVVIVFSNASPANHVARALYNLDGKKRS